QLALVRGEDDAVHGSVEHAAEALLGLAEGGLNREAFGLVADDPTDHGEASLVVEHRVEGGRELVALPGGATPGGLPRDVRWPMRVEAGEGLVGQPSERGANRLGGRDAEES